MDDPRHFHGLYLSAYLKLATLCLAALCVMLGLLVFKSQKALASAKPFIIRISDVGHAEAIDYRNFDYRPQEAENKYYLTRWANLYFGRNRYTLERDQTQALYFLNADVQRAVIEQEQKSNLISTYVKDSTLPYVDIEVKNVILDDLRQSPYSARIEFDSLGEALHYEFKPLGAYVTVLVAGVTNTAVIDKFGLNPKTMPMKPMSVEQCVSEGISGLRKNRSRVVPGRLNRIMNALVPASLARKLLADLLGKGLVSKAASADARTEV